ncbi:hypothetical protein, partial [Mycobacterium sp.]|uniref:beta strand repeat-containing protein n=1 Tax=Mycobacterium sp. TaxID=1785 RepID=UPI002BD370C5
LIGNAAADSFTLGSTLSGSITGGGGANTLTGANATTAWTVTAADAGTVTGVTGGFTQIGSLIGGSGADSFTLAGGTLSGSLAGGGGSNTLTGANVNTTWTITAADAGNMAAITGGFTQIGNLTGGTANDTFAFNGATAGVSGNIAGGTGTNSLDYSAYTGGAVTLNVTAPGIATTTGIGGTYSGINSVTGSAASDTVTGTGATYNTFNTTTKGTFTAGGIAVSSFENINDSGAATVTMTGATTGGISGNVTTAGGLVTLGAAAGNVGGNVSMGGAGTLNMGTAGTVTGTVNTATVSYASYLVPVTFNVTTPSLPGMASFTGVTSVVGSPNTDTVTGTNVTWTLTGANSGTGGGFSWSSFENLTDTGNANITGGGSVAGAIAVTGSSTLTGSIGSGGGQSYGGPITLGGATTLQSTGGGTINLGGTVNGATSLVIATTGNVALGGAIGGTTPLTAFTVAGTVPSTPPSTFPDQTKIPPAGNISFGAGADITATSNTTGAVRLSANSFTGNTTITTGDLILNAQTTIPVNNSITLDVSNFGLSGVNGNYSFGGAIISNTVATPSGSDIGVTVGGVSLKQSTLESQAASAASTASATAAQSAAKEAANTFGTDSVVEQIEYGFAGDVGTLPPIDHRLQGVGISVPHCFNDSREGEACTN